MSPTALLGAFKPYETPDPLEMRKSQADTSLAESRAAQAKQAMVDEAQVKQALGAGPFDENTIRKVAAVNPRAGATLAKVYYDGLKSQHDAAEADLKAKKEQLALTTQKVTQQAQGFGSFTGDVNQDKLTLERLGANGIFSPEEAKAMMGELESDPVTFMTKAKSGVAMALDTKAKAELASRALDDQNKQLLIDKNKAEEAHQAIMRPLQELEAKNKTVTGAPNAEGLTPEQVAANKRAMQTPDYRNYLLSKDEGFKGTFEQWQTADANRKRTVSNTNIYSPVAPPTDASGKIRAATIEDVPANIRGQVEQVLDYDRKLPPASRNNPINAAIIDWVGKIGPTVGYSEAQFANRNKIASDFGAAGQSGKAITSTDTALTHLNSIREAGKALKSGDIQALNRLANFVGAQIGSSAPTTYDSIVETVAPEISKAVIGGVGGVEDRRAMAANFSRNLSDQQREQAIAANAGLLGARYKKMATAYESDMSKPLKRKLSAESQAVLDSIHGGGSEILPANAKAQLKVGHETTFGNGQVWTIDASGKEKRIK